MVVYIDCECGNYIGAGNELSTMLPENGRSDIKTVALSKIGLIVLMILIVLLKRKNNEN
ncbi:TPA: hypothetical protein ACGBG5_000827 [Enterococcus faecalis]